MNKRGFTIIELLVSFVLISIVTFALFRTVLSIERIQQQNIYDNMFQSFQTMISKDLGNDLLNKKIISISKCDTNCYDINYEKYGTIQLKIDKDNGIFTYGNITEALPKKYKFIDDIQVEKLITNENNINSYITITLFIKSEYSDNIKSLKYMYVFDSKEDEIGFDDIDNSSYETLVYTVRRSIDSSSTAWERLDNNVGKVANATKNGSSVKNDFDNIYPWSDIITYNYDTNLNKITAYYGDSNFKFDGSNGEVLTKIPGFYYKREQKDGYEYVSISKYAINGYTYSPEFSVGRYSSSYDGTKLHSISNTLPEVVRNITWFRTESKKLGSNFGQMDYHYFLLEMLYLVEYADYNSQSKLGSGIAIMSYSEDDKALIAENNTNRIVINTTGANAFVVGQYINIGTSLASTSIAKYRKITSISDYSSGGVTGKSITFDGTGVNIAVDNVVYSSSQISGGCDSLGMKSGTLNNDSKTCMIYRGIENIYGNLWQFVDGINIKDRVAYINYNPSTYQVDTFTGNYKQIGYTNANLNGYAKTLGYDPNNPIVGLATDVGGSATTYLSDYYYQNSGNRIAIFGGNLDSGIATGLWYWNLNNASSVTSFRIGTRLLKY